MALLPLYENLHLLNSSEQEQCTGLRDGEGEAEAISAPSTSSIYEPYEQDAASAENGPSVRQPNVTRLSKREGKP